MVPLKLLLAAVAVSALNIISLDTGAWSATAPNVNKLIVKRNYKAAFQQLATQANGDNAEAQYRLGVMYRLGLGTPRDETKARIWLAKASHAGNAGAVLILKRMEWEPPPTAKKAAAVGNANPPAAQDGIVLNKLPARPAGQADWTMLAAARNNSSVATALLAQANLQNSPESQSAIVQAAVKSGAAETVSALLTSGGDVNRVNSRLQSPLMLAAIGGNLAVVDAVLGGKPNLLLKDQDGNTAFDLAARNCAPNVMARLVEAGADVSHEVTATPPLVSIVRSCPDWSKFARFLPAMDVNVADEYGRSPVWYAASIGNMPAFNALSGAGADIAAADASGFAPLHAAAANGRAEILAQILSKGVSPAPSASGTTALMLASFAGCAACISPLLEHANDTDQKNSDGDTALMFAVRGGHGDMAKMLVARGANPNARNLNGDTPFKLAKRIQLSGFTSWSVVQ